MDRTRTFHTLPKTAEKTVRTDGRLAEPLGPAGSKVTHFSLGGVTLEQ